MLFIPAGKAGDTYSFGCWCASDSVPMGHQPNYASGENVLCGEKSIRISFYYQSTLVNEETAYFGADTNDWQFACSSAAASGVHNKVVISIRFCHSRNTAYFDGLQLYREEFAHGYKYNGNGNLVAYTSLIDQEDSFEYDDDNNLIKFTDAMGGETTYDYDENHNLISSITPEGVESDNIYDTNGNVTVTRVGSSTEYIQASTAYNSASALVSAVTDARGYSVSYAYNGNTRQQTGITDANGNTSTYGYGNAASMLRLASLTSPTGTGNSTAVVSYTYDQYGKLTTISRDSTDYSFTYDAWGNVIETKVGNITLSTNTYDAYGRLSETAYGNGYGIQYVYDSLDRVERISEYSTGVRPSVIYEFVYNGEGDLYELRNYKIHRATFFEYDHAGRCMSSTEKSFTGTYGSTITYTGTVSGYGYKYDANNNLLELTCNVVGSNWTTNYHYDGDNRPTETVFHNGRKIVVTYDDIGRITSKALKNGNSTILNTTVGYTPGANGSGTALVASYQNGSDAAYNYTYDANGNITQIWRGSGDFSQASVKFSYVYDKANQLIRENLYYGSGNGNNATYTYTYDEWGNLLFRKKYTYNTQANLSNHDLIETIAYGYSNTQWGDLLTSFNGQSITYDAMGNPTSYLGKTLAWEGKKLISYTDGSTNIAYAYNEDGLRLSKTVGTNITEYYYNGSVLIGMRIGTGSTAKFLRFSYDASGNVVAVDYSSNNGSSFTSYYYLRNAQNDIVKLIDGSGNTVVEYVYDSWGKVIAATSSLTNGLKDYQPFRYRGYVYDEETGWYYLQSCYYDPATCRFISADVLLSTGQGVIGHNAFAYCGNNSVVRIDSLGTFFFTIVGAVVGGIIGAATAAINGEDVVAGAVGGAVSGAITGLMADITAASGGTAAPVAAIVVGGVAGAAGEIASQMVGGVRSGKTVSEAANSIDWVDVGIGAICGGVAGCFSSVAGSAIEGAILQPAKELYVESCINGFAGETSKALLHAATTTSALGQCADAIYNTGIGLICSGIKAIKKSICKKARKPSPQRLPLTKRRFYENLCY